MFGKALCNGMYRYSTMIIISLPDHRYRNAWLRNAIKLIRLISVPCPWRPLPNFVEWPQCMDCMWARMDFSSFSFLVFQMEAKIVFSRLLQTFKIKFPDSYELVAVQRGIVQTKDDVNCTLKRRC